jgi:hypothetical protein
MEGKERELVLQPRGRERRSGKKKGAPMVEEREEERWCLLKRKNME